MFPIKQFYPNFLKHRDLAPWSEVLSIHYTDCATWYEAFTERIRTALNRKEYLPVYRISHGEYILAVGHKLHKNCSLFGISKYYYQELLRALGVRPLFYSGSKDNSYEEFSKSDINEAKKIYISGLKEVEKNGMLAMSFYLNRGFEEYITPYRNWLSKLDVRLTKENYFSFYMVYCLLAGPDAFTILNGRKVLVVSSFTKEKAQGLTKSLKERGVINHHFLQVSPSKAIFDKLDTSQVPFVPDLVLIGAGVGSGNVILQLKKFACVMIDAGFALDALAFSEKRWNRPYCVSDDKFDPTKIKFKSVR